MNDVSKLSGASPVSPTSNRVWKPPRKQKPGEHPTGKKRKQPRKGKRDEQDTVILSGEQEAPATEDTPSHDENGEPLSYGSGGLKKPRNHKVDLVI